MDVDTHAFKESFAAGKKEGFAVIFDDTQSRAFVGVPFVAQKYNDGHLCIFVFEDADSAEKERVHFPSHDRMAVRRVSMADVRAFAAVGYFGSPATAFLRDRQARIARL